MSQCGTARPDLYRLLFLSACIASAAPAPARAQVIPVKTARIAEADLSSYIPSANAGMGRLLTLPDSVLDPFNNPATGRRRPKLAVLGSPQRRPPSPLFVHWRRLRTQGWPSLAIAPRCLDS